MKTTRFGLYFGALVLLSLASCTNDTTSVNPNPNGTTIQSPGAGSVFHYHAVIVDSAGNALTESNYATDSVVAVGITKFGKHNVTQHQPGIWFSLVNYEANGDISYYTDLTGTDSTASWVTVPIATRGKAASRLRDTTQWMTLALKEEANRNVHGTVFKVESFNEYVYRNPPGDSMNIHTVHYDPATGMLLEMDQATSGSWKGVRAFEQRNMVVDYVIK